MTVLYRLDADASLIAKTFSASAGDDRWQGGYVAPGKFAPIVTGGREFVAGPAMTPLKPRLVPRLWGVPPPPNSDDPTRAIFSVRNPESPFWIGNLRNQEFRCLVPASAFMEWGKGAGSNLQRHRHWFIPSDQELFAFAGVWKDSEVPSFAMLTCTANAELRRNGIQRMPVILPAFGDALEKWLFADWTHASTLLQPYSSSLLKSVDKTSAARLDGNH